MSDAIGGVPYLLCQGPRGSGFEIGASHQAAATWWRVGLDRLLQAEHGQDHVAAPAGKADDRGVLLLPLGPLPVVVGSRGGLAKRGEGREEHRVLEAVVAAPAAPFASVASPLACCLLLRRLRRVRVAQRLVDLAALPERQHQHRQPPRAHDDSALLRTEGVLSCASPAVGLVSLHFGCDHNTRQRGVLSAVRSDARSQPRCSPMAREVTGRWRGQDRTPSRQRLGVRPEATARWRVCGRRWPDRFCLSGHCRERPAQSRHASGSPSLKATSASRTGSGRLSQGGSS